ncbi:MAG: flagellar motor protein MotB [Bacteroidetes bacterium]|nr:flagellar motor protein MotB [Bacteroidota bacterium]
MRAYWMLLLLLLQFNSMRAQDVAQERIPKKAVQLHEKALMAIDDGRTQDAVLHLDAALALYPRYVDAWLTKAGIYLEMRRYESSAQAYEKVLGLDAEYTQEFLLPYSIALAGTGDFNHALDAVNRFLMLHAINDGSRKAALYRKNCYRFALDYSDPVAAFGWKVVNAGDSINTTASEYYPSLTIDQGQLIFTRRTRNGMDEDFFGSHRTDSGWNQAAPLSGAINTLAREGAQQISQDGKWMVFAAKDLPAGFGSFDIYVSYYQHGGWSTAQNPGASINTEFWESAPCLSPDKQSLYFASDRPGGYGGTDIYVAHRLQNDKWSTAQNLGPVINSAGDESSPFLHADGQTLFFNSNGHPGIGGTDLFKSTRTNQGFSAPQNLGYPINSISDEGSLFVTADGAKGFFASDREDARGGLDIYSLELPPSIRPLATTWVEGTIVEKKSGNPVTAVVEVVNLQTGLLTAAVQADEQGNYLAILPRTGSYSFSVHKKGYAFYAKRYTMDTENARQSFRNDIALDKLETGSTIVLQDVLFETGKAELHQSDTLELKKVYQLLLEYPGMRMQIDGHTDNTGNPAANQLLSEQRSAAVKEYLLKLGVAANRLVTRGFGDTQPIADNASAEGRSKNRRTVLYILSL